MPDYNTPNSVIYKISCKNKEIDLTYIGSTISFRKRKENHKVECNNEAKTKKLYKTIRENGGWNNWDMIIIEVFPCESKTALHTREQYWIAQETKPLNERLAYITEEEKKEKEKAQTKAYREANKEMLAEKYSVWFEANKDKRNATRRETWAKKHGEIIKKMLNQ
jgi:hypothetical protein